MDGVSRVIVLRLLFGAIAVAALVLGYVGLTDYLRQRSDLGQATPDVLYYDLQLFVLDPAPLDRGGPYPLALEIARFAAPAVTVYALADAIYVLFSERLRNLRMRRTRDHCLVWGAGPAAEVLAGKLAAAGERIVTIGPQSGKNALHFHLEGDSPQSSMLRKAGVHKAKALFAFSPESSANARIVLTAQRLLGRNRREPFNAYMHVADPDLCQGLRARRLGHGEAHGFRLDFFNPAQMAARVLLEDHPLAGTEQHILVVGLTPFGRELTVELARQWRMLAPVAEGRPTMTVVDRDASRIIEQLLRRFAFMGLWDVITIDRPAEEFDPRQLTALGALPDRTILCQGDSDIALHTAVTATDLWQGQVGSIVVAVDQSVTYGEAFATGTEEALLDDLSGRLVIHGILDAACDPIRIGDDLVEQLARAIHEHYVLHRLADGETRLDNASAVPWRELPEDLRQANRSQALDIGKKLSAIGATLAPRANADLTFSFTADEVERLARMEHDRWTREREQAGWTFGPLRDADRRHHPQMIDWLNLSDEAKEKDREAVRALPQILADAGFEIVRFDPPPAPPVGG